jgi:hypothetical protein
MKKTIGEQKLKNPPPWQLKTAQKSKATTAPVAANCQQLLGITWNAVPATSVAQNVNSFLVTLCIEIAPWGG